MGDDDKPTTTSNREDRTITSTAQPTSSPRQQRHS
ncbi:hypothetical protein F442_20394 [Phytophthora nicotianae P10297]|uniref:Uncharacterized protein n=1 Tax=Phytophthora nicotianae P10297 TaxID=1317064 RepID=W2Y8Y6_PHYNI|nr:hypothetical protein F442_20394 [Phytophthora nicotianae P10297]